MEKEGNYQDTGIRCETGMPVKSLVGRRPRPNGGNNRRHALRGIESIFSDVRRSDATSQQPIADIQPNSSADTHTHG